MEADGVLVDVDIVELRDMPRLSFVIKVFSSKF
jgi:hypothetical protein